MLKVKCITVINRITSKFYCALLCLFYLLLCNFWPRKNRNKFHCVHGLKQHVIDAAINKWRKRLAACVCADGQHFEHFL